MIVLACAVPRHSGRDFGWHLPHPLADSGTDVRPRECNRWKRRACFSGDNFLEVGVESDAALNRANPLGLFPLPRLGLKSRLSGRILPSPGYWIQLILSRYARSQGIEPIESMDYA